MFRVKPYLLLICTLIYLTSFSQKDSLSFNGNVHNADKIQLFPKQHGTKKWKFLVGLDARRSYFAGTPVKINGLRVGVEYKGVHRFGLGIYFLNRNVLFSHISVDEPDAAAAPDVQFNLGYTSLFYERVFLKTRWWEVSYPLHIGAGSIRAFYRDTSLTYKPLLENPFSAVLGSAQVKFYPLEWFYIRGAAGYRLTFNTAPEVKQTFNRPFWGIGAGVNILGMYRAIFGDKESRAHKKENRETKKENKIRT